jgi:hypothetical protein
VRYTVEKGVLRTPAGMLPWHWPRHERRGYRIKTVVLAKHKNGSLMMVPAWTETCRSDCRNFVLIFLWFYNCLHHCGTIKVLWYCWCTVQTWRYYLCLESKHHFSVLYPVSWSPHRLRSASCVYWCTGFKVKGFWKIVFVGTLSQISTVPRYGGTDYEGHFMTKIFYWI